jgi:hypothetical protein
MEDAKAPPAKGPFVIDMKKAGWYYGVTALVAVFSAIVLIEGPVSKAWEARDRKLMDARFKAQQQDLPLTENRVRLIVKEEMKDVVRKDDLKLLTQQLEEISRRLSSLETRPAGPTTPRPR